MSANVVQQPVAVIQFVLLPNGQIQASAQGGNPILLLGMLELGKANLMKQFTEKKEPGVVLAPPGMSVPRA